jgi:hypothetical protein
MPTLPECVYKRPVSNPFDRIRDFIEKTMRMSAR